MDDKLSKSGLEQESAWSSPHVVRDILIVGSPIVVMGVIGNVVGLSTLAGGAIINLGYVLMILVGAIVLKQQGSSWRQIGLGIPASWLKTALLGVGSFVAAVVVFVAIQGIAIGLLAALGLAPSEIDQSRFNPIEGSLPLFILMIALAWTTIAFGEELFYRAFLITRMLDYTNMGRGLSVLIAGIIFGAVHFAEGPVGILSNGTFGILFGSIFVLRARNLWITIIAHALLNTLRFTLLYLGAA